MRAESQEKDRRSRIWVSKEETTGGSAAELRVEHVDYGVLPGDDLSLPDQRDGHQAHREDAQGENQSHLSF
jgi:hypothetical protein